MTTKKKCRKYYVFVCLFLASGLIVAASATDFYVASPSLVCTNINNVTGAHCFDGANVSAVGTYAELYFHNDSGETVVINAADTYVNITILENGFIKGFSAAGGVITTHYDGIYKVDYSTSFAGGANDEYHMAVGINGAEAIHCHNARLIGAGGDVGNAGGTCLLSLVAGNNITFMIENEDDADNIILQDVNLNIVLIE